MFVGFAASVSSGNVSNLSGQKLYDFEVQGIISPILNYITIWGIMALQKQILAVIFGGLKSCRTMLS
mgnify:CR=1 FL=1